MSHRKEPALSISCLLLALLLTMVRIQQQDKSMVVKISPEILWFHVLVNSSSNEDQELKPEVKSFPIDTINKGLFANVGREETCTYIGEHQSGLGQTVETYMKQAEYDYPVAVALANYYFPIKAYGGVVLPCRNHDAAEVVAGSGRGQNWWYVLYSQLCFVDTPYRVVPGTSKKLLRNVLTQEKYLAILDNRNKKLQAEIHFRMLDVMKNMIEKR